MPVRKRYVDRSESEEGPTYHDFRTMLRDSGCPRTQKLEAALDFLRRAVLSENRGPGATSRSLAVDEALEWAESLMKDRILVLQ